ncbi:MAG: hypothetical protein OXC68_07125 [Aestuariivita sp.]|nr:hypothetical protein [Aestuariivita sp.]
MSKFKKEELRNFIRDGAGEYPPVFVGRDTILSDVLDMSNRARERGYASPKNTHIIQGAPGAGKTSILKALELRGNVKASHVPFFAPMLKLKIICPTCCNRLPPR